MTQGNTPMPELLAPAGGPAAFRAALAAGADAIYCGLGNDFNARRGAANFDDESFRAACHAAHVAGTRVYVTINVVIKSAEMGRALALVRRAWLLGADAFIIQDWGLLAEVRRLWPQVECHISTQANVHDARGTEWCRDLGAERVTLSRELSLPEIATIGATGVETEVFGHGALCFCYSGVCLLSSMSGGRSANRGLCAQPCRLPYVLQDRKTGRRVAADGRDRPLCPRDACTVDDVDELAAARAGSLKVEGRMKAPDYVLSVASVYREVLDDLEADREVPDEVAEARRMRLKRAFNRDFTDAYLRGTAGDEMMSYERSNNRGQVVGEVVSSRRLPDATRRSTGANGGRQRNRRTTRAEVMLRLDLPVGKGDLLEFRPDDDPDQFLTAHVEADACAGQTIRCVAARPMPAGCPVRLIRCQAALDAAARLEQQKKTQELQDKIAQLIEAGAAQKQQQAAGVLSNTSNWFNDALASSYNTAMQQGASMYNADLAREEQARQYDLSRQDALAKAKYEAQTAQAQAAAKAKQQEAENQLALLKWYTDAGLSADEALQMVAYAGGGKVPISAPSQSSRLSDGNYNPKNSKEYGSALARRISRNGISKWDAVNDLINEFQGDEAALLEAARYAGVYDELMSRRK